MLPLSLCLFLLNTSTEAVLLVRAGERSIDRARTDFRYASSLPPYKFCPFSLPNLNRKTKTRKETQILEQSLVPNTTMPTSPPPLSIYHHPFSLRSDHNWSLPEEMKIPNPPKYFNMNCFKTSRLTCSARFL
ncbi:hypothetical protein L2E82_25229 [Cichorium intybus]|uniref:Uncharacterized protein n=1 Tax=Cichorium intybus TaxID=13427 RepID=A0ACB9E3P0_CICIN|nr:hypothetical protein L2E82_25229 [Cichorium intybus]